MDRTVSEYATFQKEFLGRGVSFPVEADPLYGRISEAAYERSIEQAVRLIVLTSKGERVMRPDFGCSIRDYMFATPDFTTISRVNEEVEDALVRFEPRITDIEVDASFDDGCLSVAISYTVRGTNNPFNLVFPFYLEEGYGVDEVGA